MIIIHCPSTHQSPWGCSNQADQAHEPCYEALAASTGSPGTCCLFSFFHRVWSKSLQAKHGIHGPKSTAPPSHNLGLSFGSGENMCRVASEKNTRPQKFADTSLARQNPSLRFWGSFSTKTDFFQASKQQINSPTVRCRCLDRTERITR